MSRRGKSQLGADKPASEKYNPPFGQSEKNVPIGFGIG